MKGKGKSTALASDMPETTQQGILRSHTKLILCLGQALLQASTLTKMLHVGVKKQVEQTWQWSPKYIYAHPDYCQFHLLGWVEITAGNQSAGVCKALTFCKTDRTKR